MLRGGFEMKRRTIKKLLAILLPIAIVICSLQFGGVDRVEARDLDPGTLVIKASEINTSASLDKDGYEFDERGRLALRKFENYELVLDKDFDLVYISCYGSLSISAEQSHKLTLSKKESGTWKPELYVDKDLTIESNVTVDFYSAGYGIHANNVYINGGAISASYVDGESHYVGLIEADESIKLSGGSYIKKPEGGKISEMGDLDEVYRRVTIVDAEGNAATEVEIATKKETPAPEEASEITPTKEEEKSSDSSKKSYKNEWVNGQWYDANGKTSYKYKGSWKRDSIGWWYEDENGWFPTSRWQKIDGDWYYFDDIGYMAENQYAGNWDDYAEGFWWVGADGTWDGSEPGVWRLVGTKWWFKDSTGWYAKGKWYKIGGTWYEFDNDGWWIEK